jgi:hypothetical protein
LIDHAGATRKVVQVYQKPSEYRPDERRWQTPRFTPPEHSDNIERYVEAHLRYARQIEEELERSFR